MWELCKDLQSDIVGLRRSLHRIPEVGLDLPETSACVAAELDRLGIPYVRSKKDSGIIATFQGGGSGRTVALRADMDALPVREETGLPFASAHPGCMHACGHDCHTAMLLGAGRVLWENRDRLNGTVRLLFQTGEEQARGALVMMENGGLEGVDAVFAMHMGTHVDHGSGGVIITTPGCCTASFDHFVIRVRGKGCHGSTPEKGVDPVNIAAHIILGLQTIRARELAAVRPLVLTIGKIAGGSQYNVIPDEVVIEGTTRTLEDEVRRYAARRIEEIARNTAAVYGGTADCEMIWGAPPVVNDAGMTALAVGAAGAVLGKENVIAEMEAPGMGGEDFAYYLEKVPGAYLFLCSANGGKGMAAPHHSPRFDVDEDVLWQGSAVFVKIVEDFLHG